MLNLYQLIGHPRDDRCREIVLVDGTWLRCWVIYWWKYRQDYRRIRMEPLTIVKPSV